MIDISGVNVRDRIKVSTERGDELTATVVAVHRQFLETEHFLIQDQGWDTLEILDRRPVPGYYKYSVSGLYSFGEDGIWRDVTANYRATDYAGQLFRAGELTRLVPEGSAS